MILRQWQQVLDGVKTQTRRVLKPGEQLVIFTPAGSELILTLPTVIERVDAVWNSFGYAIHAVNTPNGRRKHEVGRTYPIIPKRAEKQVGRFTLTQIRIERLQQISQADAKAEGVVDVDAYRNLWESINGKVAGWRWEDNPVVVVYTMSHRNMDYRRMLEEWGSK